MFMALVRAPGNAFTRIMLSQLVIFAIDFPCKCFTVESPTIIVQGLFLCRVLGLLCSIISSLSDFLSAWSRGSLSLVLLLEFLFTWVLSQVLLFNWLILSFLWFLSFSFSRWLLRTVDVYILFIFCWSVWVLTSVFLDVI